jgi:hypothetical protein
MRSLLAAVAATAAVASAAPPGYAATPAGYVLSECVHNVPAGAHLQRTSTGVTVTDTTGAVSLLPLCTQSADRPMIWSPLHGRSSKPHVRGQERLLQFPADYRGWIEASAIETRETRGSSNSVMDTTLSCSMPMLLLLP